MAAQVDLVLERADHCTNLIELKFSNSLYVINAMGELFFTAEHAKIAEMHQTA